MAVGEVGGPTPRRRRRWRVGWSQSIGLRRTEQQDSFFVGLDLPFGGRRVDAFAVMDGVGGAPAGREAANAAAKHFRPALRDARSVREMVERVNAKVLETGGATTLAAAICAPNGAGWVVSAGDSSVYHLPRPASGARRLNPHDRGPGNSIVNYLGAPLVRPAIRWLRLRAGSALVLCTDGVDAVIGPPNLVPAPRARPWRLARDLVARVLAAGAPDNATVVVARRRAGRGDTTRPRDPSPRA